MPEPELGQPFCGMSAAAIALAARGDCRWTHSPVSFAHHIPGLPAANITADQIDQICREVVALWTSVCGIDLRFQSDPNANILAGAEAMDGPNGVLGESYLPCGNVNPRTQLTQRYDTGERWTLSFFFRVVLHEVGHALGLPHAPQGEAVMSPYLTQYTTLQPWDIEASVSRYGPPVARPVPPTEPTPPPDPGPGGGDPIVVLDNRLMNVPGSVVVPIPQAGTYGFRINRTGKPNRVSVTLFRR